MLVFRLVVRQYYFSPTKALVCDPTLHQNKRCRQICYEDQALCRSPRSIIFVYASMTSFKTPTKVCTVAGDSMRNIVVQGTKLRMMPERITFSRWLSTLLFPCHTWNVVVFEPIPVYCPRDFHLLSLELTGTLVTPVLPSVGRVNRSTVSSSWRLPVTTVASGRCEIL